MADSKIEYKIGSTEELEKQLKKLVSGFLSFCDWITNNLARSNKNLILFNVLSGSSVYIDIASQNFKNHISIIAMCTRSLYELNVRVRHILKSEENLKTWQSEMILDKIQVLEGVMSLKARHSKEPREILENEIDWLKKLVKKHKLPQITSPLKTSKIAIDFGLKNEHQALFKLFSKLVHPSSYLINDKETLTSYDMKNILIICLQKYALDTFQRIREVLKVPEEIDFL